MGFTYQKVNLGVVVAREGGPSKPVESKPKVRVRERIAPMLTEVSFAPRKGIHGGDE